MQTLLKQADRTRGEEVNDLRKAAEMALEALEDIFGKEKVDVGAINALRQALAPEVTPEVTPEVDETAHDVPQP